MIFYRFAHLAVGGLYRLLYRLRIVGREHVPEGGVIVCVNHSSLADPVLVALALKPRDHPRFMAKAELFRIFGFNWLIKKLGAFPVERGTSDITAIKGSLQFLKEGSKVLIFPHGRRVESDEEAAAMKAGAAMLAFRSGAPILPVYLSPGRKCFVNRIEVIFGEPFFAEKTDGSRVEQYAAVSERLRREIYALKAQTVSKQLSDD
ncbi:MAG: 1-acyl-sn-glycerol-3-phosphate acyltransferase [Oscillospiraceae bacterium]|jgi:1-acyl-sn-glycerol-3-phosphate acyltransferase|nr:1-acyl-sn-glycerol-3-phosphate acyltransferase [Oscillospiraceae bacterium]